MEKLKALLDKKVITRFEYECYLLYEIHELGKNFLKNVIEMYYMEEPPELNAEANFAWKDGRMSTWRDVKQSVNIVQSLLEGEENDGRN